MYIEITTLGGEGLLLNLFAVLYFEVRKEGVSAVLVDGDCIGIREDSGTLEEKLKEASCSPYCFTEKNGVCIWIVCASVVAVVSECKSGVSLAFMNSESKTVRESFAEVKKILKRTAQADEIKRRICRHENHD